jgi:hypothetical protein
MTYLFVVIALVTAAACALVNAIRGGGQGWMRPIVGIVAGLGHLAVTMQIIPSVIITAGIWLWLTQPWGRWYTLGHGARELSGAPNRWEKPIERIADQLFSEQRGKADALAWLMSGTVFALPLIIFSSLWWLILTPATVCIYALSIKLVSMGPHVRVGEIVKGAAIGLIAVLLVGCAVPYREPQPDWGGITREVGRNINR